MTLPVRPPFFTHKKPVVCTGFAGCSDSPIESLPHIDPVEDARTRLGAIWGAAKSCGESRHIPPIRESETPIQTLTIPISIKLRAVSTMVSSTGHGARIAVTMLPCRGDRPRQHRRTALPPVRGEGKNEIPILNGTGSEGSHIQFPGEGRTAFIGLSWRRATTRSP
jgi:hypothetical protein